MCVPEETHVFHEMTPKTGSKQCLLCPPAEPAKDASLWGREQHSRPTRSKKHSAAGHWPGADKSGVLLSFVSCETCKRC